MKSMTGFGRGAASGDGFALAVEIKTVNNRFLDIHLRLGQELSAIELDIRKRVSARLSRGRVDISINFDRTGETKYELNQGIIAGYVDALRDIQRQFNLTGVIDVNAVARLPGALTTAREGLNDTERAAIYHALDQALNDLEKDEVIQAALGPIYPEFLKLKRMEWNDYHRQVSAWEVERYLTML